MIVNGGGGSDVGIVVAVDPGETTGLACVDAGATGSGVGLVGFYSGEVAAAYGRGSVREVAEVRIARNIVGRIEGMQDQADRRRLLAAEPHTSENVSDLIIEDFSLRMFSSDKNLLAPVRLTQSILAFVEMSSTLIVRVHFQTPSDMKSVITNEMLRRRGMWHSGQTHSNDAARHLLLWLRKHRGWT